MTKKETSNLLFGLFAGISGLACFFWAANIPAGYGFLIGGGWVATINVFQYLIERRVVGSQ
jgi:hypothetical protein